MFYSIHTRDLPARHEAFLLQKRDPPRTASFRFRSMYADLVCRKCNRVNELAALTRGISHKFVVPLHRDAITTCDHFLVVTQRLHDVLIRVPGLEVHSFAVPSSPDHLVLFPKRQFHPPPDARLYTPVEPPQLGDAFQVRGHPCRKCGRIRSMTFWPHWFSVPPDVVLAGAMIEVGRPGVSIEWIASQAVVDVIQQEEFTGLSIRRQDAYRDLRWPSM